jgi:hypothetical protein
MQDGSGAQAGAPLKETVHRLQVPQRVVAHGSVVQAPVLGTQTWPCAQDMVHRSAWQEPVSGLQT